MLVELLNVSTFVSLGGAAVAVASAFAAQEQGRRQLRFAWDRELMEWAHQALEAAARAATYSAHSGLLNIEKQSEERFSVLSALSSAIDQGRLFYENIGATETDRGFRPDHLDPLVSIFRHMQDSSPDIQIIREEQVAFVRKLQAILDTPTRRRWVRASNARAGRGSRR